MGAGETFHVLSVNNFVSLWHLLCNDQSEWSWVNLKTCILIRVAVCGLFFPRLAGFFLCVSCNNCSSFVPHLIFAIFSLTGMSDGVQKKVAEVSVIWVLVFMFPFKIVHPAKQREETVWTSRTFFVEVLASKVVAQVIAQKFVQGKVSVVYSLKLLHSG